MIGKARRGRRVGARRPGARPTRRERERAAHRSEILAAAEQVFARQGYAAATMADIARAAEFAVGTLYKHFDSKEDLFEQLVLEQVTTLDAEVAAAIESSDDVKTAIENVAVADARSKARRRSFLSIFISPDVGAFRAVGPELPAVQAVVRRRRERFLALIRKGVASGELTRAISPELLALALMSSIRAYSVERVVRDGAEIDEVEVRAFVRAQLAGLQG